MTKAYSAKWVIPVAAPPIEDGVVAVDGDLIIGVGNRKSILAEFPEATVEDFGESAIIPGLVNCHTHLELTVMRGFLEREEGDFFSWLKKLTVARTERMTDDDLCVSATWGALEAARAGITCVADASDSARESMAALRDVGLRGIVYQESFGPDPAMAQENFDAIHVKITNLREFENGRIRVGVSPHAPYTVSAPQLELISRFALAENLPLMMHAAESEAEVRLILDGTGPFAENLSRRGIVWRAPGMTPIKYLKEHGILETKPLLAHCVRVDGNDIEVLCKSDARIASCPKSNAKLGHGRALFSAFISHRLKVGLGSDSVASNNTCDIIEEARFATLLSRSSGQERAGDRITAEVALHAATLGGAQALGMDDRIGALAVGMQADLAIVALDGPHQQPVHDPVAALIFASSGRDVRVTIVAGVEVYSHGRITTIDEQRVGARVNEVAEKMMDRA